jgi:hypothetical protein
MDTPLTAVSATLDDIEHGTKCNGRCRPLALAIHRVVRDGVYVCVVSPWDLCIGHDYVPLPVEAGRFVRIIDDGRRPAPIAFPLAIPAKYPAGRRLTPRKDER